MKTEADRQRALSRIQLDLIAHHRMQARIARERGETASYQQRILDAVKRSREDAHVFDKPRKCKKSNDDGVLGDRCLAETTMVRQDRPDLVVNIMPHPCGAEDRALARQLEIWVR